VTTWRLGLPSSSSHALVGGLVGATVVEAGAGRDGPSATEAADAAAKTQRQLERVYRKAASALLAVDDLREVVGRRELYRRLSRISEILVQAADRVWYATVKEG
jgi:glutamine synthetase adenylyltransferase